MLRLRRSKCSFSYLFNIGKAYNVFPAFINIPIFLFFFTNFSNSKMTAILDQKHYIEELNRHLSGTVTDLQAKMDCLERTNSKLVEEVRSVTCLTLIV